MNGDSLSQGGAQAIRKVHDMGWKPLHMINKVAASVGVILTPASLEKCRNHSLASQKDPTDPQRCVGIS